MIASVRVVAYGIPAPQGSKAFKGVNPNTGRGVLVESSKAVKPWREAVESAARQVIATMSRAERRSLPLDGPLIGRLVLTMPKPARAPKTRVTYPDVYPDLSKLLRSTEDALTTAGLWADDARVVTYDRLSKVYPGSDPEALSRPGAVITVRRLTGVQDFPAPPVDESAEEARVFRIALERIREADPSGPAARIAADVLIRHTAKEARA